MAVQHRNADMVELLSADFVRNRLPMTFYGSFSGYHRGEIEILDTDPIILVPADNEVYSVRVACHYNALIVANSGAYGFASGEVGLSETDTLYTDSDITVSIACSATGAISIYATGSPLATGHIEITWM